MDCDKIFSVTVNSTSFLVYTLLTWPINPTLEALREYHWSKTCYWRTPSVPEVHILRPNTAVQRHDFWTSVWYQVGATSTPTRRTPLNLWIYEHSILSPWYHPLSSSCRSNWSGQQWLVPVRLVWRSRLLFSSLVTILHFEDAKHVPSRATALESPPGARCTYSSHSNRHKMSTALFRSNNPLANLMPIFKGQPKISSIIPAITRLNMNTEREYSFRTPPAISDEFDSSLHTFTRAWVCEKMLTWGQQNSLAHPSDDEHWTASAIFNQLNWRLLLIRE